MAETNPELEKRDELRQVRGALGRAIDSLDVAMTERMEMRRKLDAAQAAVAFVREFNAGERGSREVDYDDAAAIVEELDER